MKSRALKQIVSFTLVLLTIGVMVVVPAFVFGSTAHAQSAGQIFDPDGYLPDTNLVSNDLRSLTISIINILLGILGIIFLLFILYGGFLWMTAGGNDDQAKKGRTIIGNGIVGLIVIFVAFALTTFIFNILSDASSVANP